MIEASTQDAPNPHLCDNCLDSAYENRYYSLTQTLSITLNILRAEIGLDY